MEKTRLEREIEEVQVSKGDRNWFIIFLLVCLIASVVYAIHIKIRLDRLYKEREVFILQKEALQKELKEKEEELRLLKEKIRGIDENR